MKIALVDVDGHRYPNLALMKISAYHKVKGDSVEWYQPLFSRPDKIYASKVFTFTADYYDYNPSDPLPILGGTGYDYSIKLPSNIENMLPDYSIYPQYKQAFGFLTRGCIRNCPWCIVPKKEGYIKPVDDIERIANGRKHVILMDNNFLATDDEFIKEQLEKIERLKLFIDFNQALDARFVTEDNAKLLSRIHWKSMNGNTSYIRFSCDTYAMLPVVKHAINTLRNVGYKGVIFVYLLAQSFQDVKNRYDELMAFDKKITPFIMPYRDFGTKKQIIDVEIANFARWCNKPWLRATCKFEEYKKRRNEQ